MSCVIELTSRRWNLGHNPSEWVLLLKNVRYKHIHNDFKTHDNSSTNDAENGTYPPFNTVTQTSKPRFMVYGNYLSVTFSSTVFKGLWHYRLGLNFFIIQNTQHSVTTESPPQTFTRK